MMGVVLINKEAGTVWGLGVVEEPREAAGVASASLVDDGTMSSSSGGAESIRGSTDSRTTAGGSSAPTNRGSVTHGALCKGVEDSRCSLLACVMPSLPSGVTGVVDEGETE